MLTDWPFPPGARDTVVLLASFLASICLRRALALWRRP